MRNYLLSFASLLCMSASAAWADSETLVCRTSDNSPPCPSGVDVKMDEAGFIARYGADASYTDKMGAEFCTFTEDGEQKLHPFNVLQTEAIPGGHAGTGVWLVRCMY